VAIVYLVLMWLNGFLSAGNAIAALGPEGGGLNILMVVLNGGVAYLMFQNYKKTVGVE
jgi:hypothetical protein